VRRWSAAPAAGGPAPTGSGLGRVNVRWPGLHKVLGKVVGALVRDEMGRRGKLSSAAAMVAR
jgi:hypothetical protein